MFKIRDDSEFTFNNVNTYSYTYYKKQVHIRHQVLMAARMKVIAFCDIAPCNTVLFITIIIKYYIIIIMDSPDDGDSTYL